jgi:hypothetical protein
MTRPKAEYLKNRGSIAYKDERSISSSGHPDGFGANPVCIKWIPRALFAGVKRPVREAELYLCSIIHFYDVHMDNVTLLY